jgi:hypothetical protein
MKPIEGIELKDVSTLAKETLKTAQKEKLVGILIKLFEERDTLTVQIEKDKISLDKKVKQRDELNNKIIQIEGGNWDLIKEDGKQQPQVQGGKPPE